MLPPQIVFGYHGCDEPIARLVIEGGQLKPSSNAYDWLGHGIYFWEHSPARAVRWAAEMPRRSAPAIKKPAVLGAILNLGHCLNLTDPDSAELIRFPHDDYLANCLAEDAIIPKNKGPNSRARFLDCAVINHLHSLREESDQAPFDTVRGFFNEGEPVYPTAGLRSLDHVQVCVRNPRAILGFFRPSPVQH